MSRYLTAVFTFFLALPAMAESPNYNFVELGYQFVDLDVGGGTDVDGDGFGIGGSFEFGGDFFGFASYADTGFDFDVDLTQLQIGFGWHTELTDTTDFFATTRLLALPERRMATAENHHDAHDMRIKCSKSYADHPRATGSSLCAAQSQGRQ